MSPTHSEKNTWTSLLGCLGTGLIVITAIIAAVLHFKGRLNDHQDRINSDWLAPLTSNFNDNQLTLSWQNLTTQDFQKSCPLDTYQANYRTLLAKTGPIQKVAIHKATKEGQLGKGPLHWRLETRWEGSQKTIWITYILQEDSNGKLLSTGGRLSNKNNPALITELPTKW